MKILHVIPSVNPATGGPAEGLRQLCQICQMGGHQVEVAVSLSPIKDGGGAVIGASLVAQDISQRKQEEKERLDLIQELTSALSRTAGPWLEKTGRC